jgi:primosomal protein N' (replication factor Y)
MPQPDPPAVFRIAVPLPLPGLFDYLAPAQAAAPVPGQRVVVPFGPRRLVGIVVAVAGSSELPLARLQAIEQVLDDGQPLLPAELLRLLRWCWRYYKHPCGEVLFNALPPALRKADKTLPDPPLQYALEPAGEQRLALPAGREKARLRVLQALAAGPLSADGLRALAPAMLRSLPALLENGWVSQAPLGASLPRPRPGPHLTAEQAQVVAAIQACPPGYTCHLLDGVTGSGKTEVYLQLLEPVLAAGQQALVLVPEIGLTPQLLRRFRERLGCEPMVSHSSLSAGERLQVWAAAASGRARLLIGTRSALFLPLRNPGIIIMDEAHDASFKQQDGFRYSARDVAVKRAADLDIPIVLGSATPSLECLHNAALGRYQHHRLRSRATGASQPAWRLVDLREQVVTGGMSAPALAAMQETLGRDEQVLVFLNRRGYAPVLLCHECGWFAGCGRCDANLTWHRASRLLVCHHCDNRMRVPDFCPACRADALQGAGEGTQQLEQHLAQRFEGIPVYRVDRDQMRRKGDLEALVQEVRKGEPCVLVGTQMLAKGHHFPKVTLVVVVNLDQALYSADYRALERMGQVLVQVAGRAGRAQHPGTVILQTHHPEHERLKTLIGSGYGPFARQLLEERELAQLPPFSFQALLRSDATSREQVQAFLNQARAAWPGEASQVHGPFPAMMELRSGRIRWYLLVQHDSRPGLQSLLDQWLEPLHGLPAGRRVRWSVDVDPQSF